ncbi:hypothetical protein N7499_011028 [Penicillium canescens]|nr:hypothetical protein N7499_011028 [Penicillium canescens]
MLLKFHLHVLPDICTKTTHARLTNVLPVLRMLCLMVESVGLSRPPVVLPAQFSMATYAAQKCRHRAPQDLTLTGPFVPHLKVRAVLPARYLPPGTHYDGHVCVFTPTVEPSCPPGTALKDGQCYTTSSPSCPPGTTFNGRVCVTSELPSCPPGLTFDGTHCVHSSQPSCPPGTTLSGSHCISSNQPSCPPGTTLTGEICVSSQRPTCPPGSTLVNQVCVYPQHPECPPGSALNGEDCVAGTPPHALLAPSLMEPLASLATDPVVPLASRSIETHMP